MKTYKAKVDLFGAGSATARAFSECGEGRRWAEKCALDTLQTVFDEATSMDHLDALSVQATGSALYINVRTEGSLEVCDKEGYLKIKTQKWSFELENAEESFLNARLWTIGDEGTKRTLDNRKTTVDIQTVPEDYEQAPWKLYPEISLFDVTAEAFESVQERWYTAYGRDAKVRAISLLSEQEEVA